jgi:hypothetical protein
MYSRSPNSPAQNNLYLRVNALEKEVSGQKIEMEGMKQGMRDMKAKQAELRKEVIMLLKDARRKKEKEDQFGSGFLMVEKDNIWKVGQDK